MARAAAILAGLLALAGAPDVPATLDAAIGSADVVMFALPSCPFCKRAEAALRKEHIDFAQLPIGPFKQALKARTGKGSAPSVWIHGEFVGGCNDGTKPWHGVLPMLASGRFQQMVAAGGTPPPTPPPTTEGTSEQERQALLRAMTGAAGGHYQPELRRTLAMKHDEAGAPQPARPASELAPYPPMHWHSWNTFCAEDMTNHTNMREMADALISSGMAEAGYRMVNVVCSGWVGRDPTTHELLENRTLWPDGIAGLAKYLHSKDLQLGCYTSPATHNCCGEPGSLGFEAIDMETFARWGCDHVMVGKYSRAHHSLRQESALPASSQPS